MDIHNELIESLENCVSACNYCAASCLNEENVYAMTDCINLDLDCADTCQLALKLLVRDITSPVSIIEFCREICAACAAECENHDHEHCRKCAEACRLCEDHCKIYLNNKVSK